MDGDPVICSNCATENPIEARFCLECGQGLVQSCANCGTALPPAARFCFSCGQSVEQTSPPPTAPADGAQAAASVASAFSRTTAGATQLRQVSVLFCDLVDFTTLSESRDPEEVRELLSGYFELARSVVSRYGGTIEKFIGDAVMAVWGAPVAKEDDAERAVRSALDLAAAISAYGDEHGVPLDARIGVATGAAATTTPRRGHRHRRPGEHRGAHPVRRAAAQLLRRRRDEELHFRGDRLPRRRRIRIEREI